MAAINILQYNIRSYTPYFFFGAKKIVSAGSIQIQRARNKLCLVKLLRFSSCLLWFTSQSGLGYNIVSWHTCAHIPTYIKINTK